MQRRMRTCFGVVAVCLPLFLMAEERIDLFNIHRIKDEAFNRSKVMDHLFYLTDVHGPRVTNSPGYLSAANWAMERLTQYGLVNVHTEKWPFGRSWAMTRFSAHLLEPQYAPLIGFPLVWTSSTNGAVTGEPMMVTISTEADMEKWKGKLSGKIIMTDALRELAPHTVADTRRFTEAELAAQAQAPEPGGSPFAAMMQQPAARAALGPQPPADPEQARAQFQQMRTFRQKVGAFMKDQGVALILQMGSRGDGGTIFAQQAGSQDPKVPLPPPTVALAAEHYNRIVRLIQNKVPVKIEVVAESRIIDSPTESINVVAEIPGGAKKDEVVMLGGHLDSWQGGTGATDNATGCAVTMEAVRIIKALDARPARTIRIALWGGEEQGLLGSREYVKAHFADPEVMKPSPEHARLAAYFNLDNGTGKIRGIYLQGNDMVRPVFEAWLAPFKDMGAGSVTIRNTGGTDHQSFDAVGLPGFQFIQDPVEYSTRTHHSNMDVYDRAVRGDLIQASVIMASFAYNAATRDEMLPRKPLPKAQPRRGGRPGEGGPPSGAQ